MKKLILIMVVFMQVLTGNVVTAADSAMQKTVLITGSNRGIGLEFVKQYSDLGYKVIATCRTPAKADELNAFAKENPNVVVERLDLLDLEGIDKLAAKYSGQPIDILVNNAALMRGLDKGQTFGTIDYDMFDDFYNINVRGTLKVTEAFWPNLKAASNGIVATLTTLPGKRGIPIPGFIFYKSSKAAMDNLFYDIGRQGKKDKVRVLIVTPGRVVPHGGKMKKGKVGIVDSIAGMIKVIDGHTIENNGETFWYNGKHFQ